ncbi:hypothetical protein GQ53DRAFT_700860 [Thozetella sp. PMI_491]|nr:hypothetical protein GQ53DRAFT_700860 [Thozetella sp. PMI_491]
MRLRATRAAAKRKSYAEIRRIDSIDDEVGSAPADEDSDDEVVIDVDAEAENDEDDEVGNLTEVTSSEDDGTADEDEDGVVVEEEGDGTSAPTKRRRRRAPVESSLNNYHDAPRYPQDPRYFHRTWYGSLKRYAKYRPLRDALYGPEFARIRTIWELDTRWTKFPLLPPKYPPEHEHGIMLSPWVAPNHEIEQEKNVVLWYDGIQSASQSMQRSHLSEKHIGQRLVPRADGELVAMLGPWSAQEEYKLQKGKPHLLTQSGRLGIEADSPQSEPAGWMMDVGGLVLAMGWQPQSIGDDQLLAIATVPHSDQDHLVPDDPRHDESRDAGTVQLWQFSGVRGGSGLASPSTKLPRFRGAKCFNWGRPRRLQWCPVPLNLAGIAGRLAILCGDGKARVLDISTFPNDAEPTYEWMDSPIAVLGCEDEDRVEVTCLTWVNSNTLALGHSDGSMSVWSVQPRRIIQRHYLHSTSILEICSGYPSNPNMVCTVPVGGALSLTDIDQASSEMTFLSTPVIIFQPNLLVWSEIMQGFFAQYGAIHGNTTMAFLHVRFFNHARTMICCPSPVMCVSAGATHPYVLVGCADGSLWSFNALVRLFSQKYEKTFKLKILEHEYRPIQPSGSVQPQLRGAVRILQGFLAEENNDPQMEARKESEKQKKRPEEKNGKPKRGRPKKNANVGPEDTDEEPPDPVMARNVIHEPFTRVTTVAWNPNMDFSCWAACAFGSGLVRVMDLGIQ